MPTYDPPGPWAGPYPVTVTDTDTGRVWEARGPNQLKRPAVDIQFPDSPEYFHCGPGETQLELDENDLVLTTDNVPAAAAYAAANDGACDPNEGMPLGKAADGTLRQQPPIKCGLSSVAQAVVTVAGPALTALAPGATNLFSNLCAKLTNDSCYDQVVDATFRSNFSMQMAPGIRNYWTMLASGGNATGTGTGNWTGATIRRQTSCETNTCIIRHSTPIAEFGTGVMNPGEDIAFCQDVAVLLINYTEHPLNSIQAGSNTVKLRSQGCQGGFLPSEQTPATLEV